MGLVDAIRAAESSLGQARSLLDAVDSAATDINRAVADVAVGDRRHPERHQPGGRATAAAQHAAGRRTDRRPRGRGRGRRRGAEANGSADPLGTFTRLTKADADLDRLLASVAEEREAAERLARAFDQALFTAQSRVKAVSDFIDTRRGSIGPEARTRLAEAQRQLEAAQAKRESNLTEAIAHANGAAMLAAQAQSLANDDVRAAQRSYTSGLRRRRIRHGRGHRRHHHRQHPARRLFRRSRRYGGGFGGGFGGGRGMGRSTSYGGSSRSSGRSYSGGRF